jgi:hypothetical protein|tara:strand:+ start:7 stop:615 length:609 start_codon:yes stop_codon:yes gene_type:complete
MILLNLIPDFQKERLNRERKFLVTHSIIGIILIVVSIHAIVLSVARIVLVSHFNKIKHDTSLVSVEHQRLQTDIDNSNKKIKDRVKIQSTFSKWSLMLTELTNLVPEGIELSFVHINQDTGAFRITGSSPTRNLLLETKTILEKSEIIQLLDAPLSNFLEKEDLNFRFAGQMDTWRYQIPRVEPNENFQPPISNNQENNNNQ